MTPARWKQIEEVFERAIELAEPERAALLATACAGDPDLRAEVELLLASAAHPTDSLHEAIARGAERLQRSALASKLGTRLGPYRLTAILGEGGMGTVYLASRDDDEYRRDVAIKILQPLAASPMFAARLRDERQLLAALDHPGIVRLLDGGSTDEGLPYLVMEYIDGVPLTTYARGLPVRARVELVVQVAGALQYANQKLVVHRDVKPNNILVDAAGVPRLLDFGIAKLLDDGPDAREARTRTGMPLFTAEYASPEQARGEPVTVATDVYSLGAVLYELLAGRPPQRRGATLVETLANVCDREPPLPSAVAPKEQRRELVGDLDNIALKALQKSPDRRYSSVAAFADDLERYLTGAPVAARAATPGYRARKYVRRHRGKLALAALVASALTVATVISIAQARRADRHALAAERDKLGLLRERGIEELALGRAWRALPYFAEVLRSGGDTPALRFLLAEAMQPFDRELAAIPVPDGAKGVAWAPDGKRFAITAMNGHVGIYRADGVQLVRIEVATARVQTPIFSPDGATLVAVDGDGRVFAWDAATGGARFTARMPAAQIWDFALAGDVLIASASDGRLVLLDARTGAVRGTAQLPSEALAVARAPDDRHVAAGTRDGIFTWDVTTTAPPRPLGDRNVAALALQYSSDGARLFAGCSDHAVYEYDVATGGEIAVFAGHTGDIVSVRVTRDDTLLSTASADGTGAIWDARSGARLAVLRGVMAGSFGEMRWSPDGAHLVTTSNDGTFRLWDRRGNAEIAFEGTPGAGDARHSDGGVASAARFSPDGTRLLTASSREVRVRRVDTGPLRAQVTVHPARPFAIAWSPDDRRIAVTGDGIAAFWDPELRARSPIEAAGCMGWDVSWSPRGDAVAIACGDGRVLIRDAHGAPVRELVGHRGIVNGVAWSPDGTRLATAGDDGTARLWDPETGACVLVLAHGDRAMEVAWRRDGALLATSSWDRTLRLWDPHTGALVRAIATGTMQLLSVAFDPTGRSLIASSHGGEVATFDVATGARELELEGHTDSVPTAAWSPDGGLIETGGYDSALRIWDPATGALLVARRTTPLMATAWSHDGTRIAGASDYGEVSIWDVRRADESVAAIVELVAKRVPFRLVGTRLERARGE